jgi:hypothetical protein
MVHLYELPEEMFLSINPCSLILIDDHRFEPDPDLDNDKGFLYNFYHWTSTRFVDLIENFLHISNIPCMDDYSMPSKGFEQNQIVTINLKTGAWMLRLPYSEEYP